jgi:hypothetical protein
MLNQRQKGARRRNEWVRKAGVDGQLHWTRNLKKKKEKKVSKRLQVQQ